ncbi:unnamed protein product [Rotaria magnacalcarata]|uniref:GTP:AMP phosphotransferase, mitochondrial n=1 Tax=Rotaria magnacalcarata TaxID=392030 RepID=A0A815IM34_9BILA|nr:unnamed protein product [Rotaria magnacalcarata]CAF1410810.1 unnamed protein product [Rotaria magnacalcarata]CAF2077891.1 unnamed protein product [Rotaria magnacalcarata]CAF2143695.1 unnamed protein product [Rotaria magnacalcarata]CAF3777379.1 unnamed protein product [Rotaria magnacalcarata]
MASQIARRLVILGAPGSGKSTIATRIVKAYGMPYIVAGDLLRQNIKQQSEESRTMKEYINKGLLIPDDLILKFLVDELEKNREQGFLLEGYPRTLNQAEMLYRQMKVDHVIAIHVPADEIINRLKDRWFHLSSGRVYNLLWRPPKEAGKDDITGEPLAQREDDKPAVIRHRLNAYNKNINPIIQFYKQLGILQDFHGRESDKIWPEVKNYLDHILKEPMNQKVAV